MAPCWFLHLSTIQGSVASSPSPLHLFVSLVSSCHSHIFFFAFAFYHIPTLSVFVTLRVRQPRVLHPANICPLPQIIKLTIKPQTQINHTTYTFKMAEIRELTLDPKYDIYTYPITNPTTGSGHPGHTTAEQDALVVQMRVELEKEGHTERLDTINLVRCLFSMSSFQWGLI